MALATLNKKVTAGPGSVSRALAVSYNATLDNLRVIMLKLDADLGVTDTNYTALFDAFAGTSKILSIDGNTITDP